MQAEVSAGAYRVTPEVLQSLTAAKGASMPNEDAGTVDKLAELFRRERRLRELVRRLERSGEIHDEQIATMARYFGCPAAGTNTRTIRPPQWSHAECALAAQGMVEKYWQAMRYVYALDDSVFHSLSTRLWEWALEKREREKWPNTVLDNGHQQIRYMRDLVYMMLFEVRRPSAFLQPGTKATMMNVTERIWDKKLSPVYAAVWHEFEIWLAIAHGHMQRRLNDEDE